MCFMCVCSAVRLGGGGCDRVVVTVGSPRFSFSLFTRGGGSGFFSCRGVPGNIVHCRDLLQPRRLPPPSTAARQRVILCIPPFVKEHFLRIVCRVLHRVLMRRRAAEGAAFTRKPTAVIIYAHGQPPAVLFCAFNSRLPFLNSSTMLFSFYIRITCVRVLTCE